MTTNSIHLTAFLLARIAEDEAVARASGGTGRDWGSNGGMAVFSVSVKQRPIAKAMNLRVGLHIARHDPARVLAECEAKRLAVRFLSDLERGEFGDAMTSSLAYSVLCRHAIPYADHPDYREEWRA